MSLARIASRRLVRVGGADAMSFLQGLVTVDMRKLTEPGKLAAGAFLNAKGRILYDVFIAKSSGEGYDIETNAETVDDFVDTLKRYKLRRKVTVSPDESRKVFTVWTKQAPAVSSAKDVDQWFRDPRPGHALGYRIWSSANAQPEGTSSFRLVDESIYHQVRLAHGISEGVAESADELPFVLNYDWWPGALTFDKGCYTGQELIARTHYKGQVRKRAMPVLLSVDSSSKKIDELLPSFLSWNVKPTSKLFPPVKTTFEPIAAGSTTLGDGALISLAPGGLPLGFAAFRDAQTVPPPEKEFKPTHVAKLENGDEILICPIRPDWWPPL